MFNTVSNQNNYTSTSLQQRIKDRQVFEQFMNKQNLVTCDKPKGKLVRENVAQQFASSIVDTGSDIKNLGVALVKGESNDNALGRMNGLGMKIGGGLIAAALMGTRTTANKKLMELFGFGTFFSVMSLWPKVAIDLPTKLIHGFNPHQKYIDSQGRKKDLFQDNQYLPLDLYSNEEINKIGDKMDVPKDLQDREEFIKEKMRMVSLQANTLWMLTAGVAAPTLTSLACNRIENALKIPVANHELKNISKQFANNGKILKNTLKSKEIFEEQDSEFRKLMSSLEDGLMPEDFKKRVSRLFDITRFSSNRGFGENTRNNALTLSAEIIDKIFPQTPDINEDFIKELIKISKVDNPEEEFAILKQVFIQAKDIAEKDFEGTGLKPHHNDVIAIMENLCSADEALSQKPWFKKFGNMLSGKLEIDEKYLYRYMGKEQRYNPDDIKKGSEELRKIYEEIIRPSQAQMKIFGDQMDALDRISGEKYNTAARTFFKALGLSDKEIKTIRNSSLTTGDEIQDIISTKIAAIAGNDDKYKHTIEKLQKELAKIEKVDNGKINIPDTYQNMIKVSNEAVAKNSSQKAKNMCEAYNNSALQKYLENVITEADAVNAKSSMTSVDAMIAKLFSSLELERKIQDGSLIKEWKKYADLNNYECDIKSLTEDEIEAFYKFCRRISWQSSYNDAMNKYHINSNSDFYKTVTDTIFSLDPEAENLSEAQKTARNITNRIKEIAKAISNETEFIPNDSLKIVLEETENANVSDLYRQAKNMSSLEQFSEFGQSVTTTIKKHVNQVYNERSWMKIFGTTAAVLVGATFISQLFFGKVKDADKYKKINQADTFESRK